MSTWDKHTKFYVLIELAHVGVLTLFRFLIGCVILANVCTMSLRGQFFCSTSSSRCSSSGGIEGTWERTTSTDRNNTLLNSKLCAKSFMLKCSTVHLPIPWTIYVNVAPSVSFLTDLEKRDPLFDCMLDTSNSCKFELILIILFYSILQM